MTTGTLHAKRLSTYLNDHLAAATGGVELAKRARGSNEGTPYGELLARLERELEEDRQALMDVMGRLAVDRNQLKVGAGWLAEKVGRLKINDQITGYSPLSRVVELEGLQLLVAGNRALWATLADVAAGRPEVEPVDFTGAVARAEAQLAAIEPLRAQAAREALAGE
ncbi:MAG TPA: hypothetical protein VM266_05555 [Solirubrobacteraceae bacterium]|nr:hypothetical protein [Solirubrobacteraceae bacterium]